MHPSHLKCQTSEEAGVEVMLVTAVKNSSHVLTAPYIIK